MAHFGSRHFSAWHLSAWHFGGTGVVVIVPFGYKIHFGDVGPETRSHTARVMGDTRIHYGSIAGETR